MAERADSSARLRERIGARVREQVQEDAWRAASRARAVRERAREEKRLAEKHRRQARRAWMTFDAFKRELEALGMTVIIEDPTDNHQATNPQGRTSDEAAGTDGSASA